MNEPAKSSESGEKDRCSSSLDHMGSPTKSLTCTAGLYENEDYEAAYHVPAGLFEGIDKDAFSSWDHGFSSVQLFH